MDIEQLSKSQIVLLTLLVSFVTSIATGIVTVSLMEQAPPVIAQTVNRVIERTVERVVPASGQAAAATVVTTEKTVVVKESDLIVQAVEKSAPSIVRIYVPVEDGERSFLALGIVLDEEGAIATDASALGEAAEAPVALGDGAFAPALVVSRDEARGIALLSASSTESGDLMSWTPIALTLDPPVLGQTVVALAGKSVSRIADGLVVALAASEEGGEAIIETNVVADFVLPGSPLISTDGALLGVSTGVSRTSSPSGFVPASVLVPEGAQNNEEQEDEQKGETEQEEEVAAE